MLVTCGAVGYQRVSLSDDNSIALGSTRCSVLNLSTLGPSLIRRLRLKRHLQRVIQDDTLLEQEGSGQRLTLPELQEALEERGLCVMIVVPL